MSFDPTPPGPTPPPDPKFAEPVWTYRGYQLRAGEFNTAMVHLFRAEVQRANVWRQRLDTTTNWAVVATGAAISLAFTQASSSHIVVPLNLLLVTMFLSIEARRYRYYELWSYRVRLMETDFFAAMLVAPFQPSPDWAETLAENLLHPHFPISIWEALGRRLRLNYLWIYGVIGVAWLAKLWLIPYATLTIPEFIDRASVATVPGAWVLSAVAAYYFGLLLLSVGTLGLHQASGEVLPRFSESLPPNSHERRRAWFRPSRRRAQYLTFIVTDQAEAVAARILSDMNRGATAFPGKGMFTGEARAVLMVALAVTEVPQLRALVNATDPHAFVVVTPAQEVFGRGFSPLEADAR
jgi:uncharacterized membrane protein